MVALRSGHRDHRSFLKYTNLRGATGKRQQEGILGSFEGPDLKRGKHVADAGLDHGLEKKFDVEFGHSEEGRTGDNVQKSDGFTEIEKENAEPEVRAFLNNVGSIHGNVTINVYKNL
ncbi:hypothetical protein FGB62_63g010 [Gracilaria domingensis]|nr:hypothetical protein FGB62_63g010 [Gracilaria domingensis]